MYFSLNIHSQLILGTQPWPHRPSDVTLCGELKCIPVSSLQNSSFWPLFLPLLPERRSQNLLLSSRGWKNQLVKIFCGMESSRKRKKKKIEGRNSQFSKLHLHIPCSRLCPPSWPGGSSLCTELHRDFVPAGWGPWGGTGGEQQ